MENMKKILVIFLILFINGCITPYKNPDYICACIVKHENPATQQIDESYAGTIGGKTPQEVLQKCNETAKNSYSQILEIKCDTLSWSEWNKKIEKEREIRKGS